VEAVAEAVRICWVEEYAMSDMRDVDLVPVEQSGWARLGHLLVQLSIIAGTAIALTDPELSASSKFVAAALAAALLGWHALMVYRWHYWELDRWPFVCAMVVATVLWVPLLLIHSGFGITIIGAYSLAACPFLGRAAASIAALSGILLVLAATDSGGLTFREASGIVLTGLLIVVIHGLVSRMHVRNVQQQQLIEELWSTRAALARQEREAGIVSERERISRDIHDSLAQGFMSIIMLLEAADAQLDSDAVDVRARIDQAKQAARENLGEARRVVWSLRPEALERGALPGAIEVLVDRSFAALDIEAQLRVEGEPFPLAPEKEVPLYRAAQEALANVAKHADATRVVCTLTYLEDEVILDVNDNGCGFDPTDVVANTDSGLGLAGLRSRIDAAGGSLDLETSPAAGTNLTVRIPVGPPLSADEPEEADTAS
jgi:signal transduction histidine kinase